MHPPAHSAHVCSFPPPLTHHTHSPSPHPPTFSNVLAIPPLPPTSTMASTTAPIPRGTAPRPRPMSLPPPTYTPSHSGTSSDRPRHYVEQPHSAAQRHSQRGVDPTKPRTTNRILGDYTLSKTLGAGSMGKVKLAHHNITGEKVCLCSYSSLISAVLAMQGLFFTSPQSSHLAFNIYRCITLVVSELATTVV